MSEKQHQSRRLQDKQIEDDLSALDQTVEMAIENELENTEAGKLALELRESGVQLKKLAGMGVMAQAAHGPALMAEVCAQIAYALEVIELNNG